MTSLDKLLLNASSSLSEHEPEILGQLHRLAGNLADQLFGVLCQCNGFCALESALHVIPRTLVRTKLVLVIGTRALCGAVATKTWPMIAFSLQKMFLVGSSALKIAGSIPLTQKQAR